MSLHPLNAFFRRGQPIPLTLTDFHHRCDASLSEQERLAAFKALRKQGYIDKHRKFDAEIYTPSVAGLQFARRGLGIEIEVTK